MADQDDFYYLQPGFDVNSLTVPRLRSILVAHTVPYPSSAKKGDLVELFQQQVLPHARKLLRDQAKVRRTSKGITDVPSSQEGTIDGDEGDKDLMPPPPAPKTPRGRKSKTNLTGDEIAPTPKSSRRSKTPSKRRSSGKTPRASDTDTDVDHTRPSARRTRKVTPGPVPVTTPSVRIQDARDQRRSLEADESPFTQDNPFQSGSSPPSGDQQVSSSTSRSRKSIGSSARKSTSKRRDTKSPPRIKQESPSSKATYDIPVSHLSTDQDGVETTEEFTQDANEELKQELSSDRRLAKARTSALTRQKKKPASKAAKAIPLTILTAMAAAVAGWYRQEKVAIGYCGVGQSRWSLANNHNIPEWVHENLEPHCEPCPQYAICFSDMEVQCDTDFVLQPHPLSFNGLIPFPPECAPDSEKQRRIKAVADKAIEALRERRAAYECGEEMPTITELNSEEQTSSVVAPVQEKLEVSEDILKQTVSKMRRKGMSAEDFENLWRGALGDIMGRDEIEVIQDGSGKAFLSSTSLARLPIGCAIRRSMVRVVSENRLPISILILVMIAFAYARQRVIGYYQAKEQTPSLVAMTLDRLATQAALKEDGRVGESFISVGQLRDDVLRNVFSADERERVWQRVRKIVEANSNVRAATREGGKTGEWSRVWEWIGPVDLAPGLEGRRSGGMIRDREEGDASNQGTPNDRSGLDVRKWDEGRAIY